VWDGAQDVARAALAKMEGFKAQMCACKDSACATRVNTEMSTWSTELAKIGTATDIDATVTAKIGEVAQAYGVCLARVMSVDAAPVRTPTPPPPPAPLDINRAIEQIADRTCACTDAACARRRVGELVALAKAHKNDRSGDEKRGEAAGRRLGECAVRAGMDAQELITTLQQISN
jgi:chorismate mutase